MKKGLLFFAAVIYLAACSNEDSAIQNSKTKVEKSEDLPEEKSISTVQVEEKDTAEEVEETKQSSEEELSDRNEAIEPKYQLNEKLWTIEPISEDGNKNVVLLTIDDAPDKHALEMAKTLKDLDVKAIFFINGHFIDTEEEKAVLKEIYDLGFPLGNHTMTHSNLKNLSEEKQREEIITLNDQIEQITGERPKFFRAPFGQNTNYVKDLAVEEEMLLMNWTYGYDWENEYQSKEAIADIMVNTPLLRAGANLLMHDREWTNAALEEIVKGIQKKGYEFLDPALIKTLK
ncbi:polysaccharide deacetylase family protein [Bacillus taeanensis]|uniref:Polysaccharide deacetylase family protein n=1 Tax=Bacillus taeanensis TaxID=273032 RepID=A0A366XXZ1_9BACI|nr:polysaccharide deacetylase family protein [Bacillus taeanensis]RBW70015.1 polysaccharide deacetylase family protein [Bacillus taeanensis]